MSIMTQDVTRVGPVIIDAASDGQIVAFVVPSGCVLTCDGVSVSDLSPVVHSGPRATYRIDCVTYTSPVSAVLEIT